SPDGKLIASSGWGKGIKIWDAASGSERMDLTGHEGAVQCVAFSPDGRTIATGDWDRALRVWEASQFRAAAGATAAEAN
ncbi:MAG TPA: protein kinase, partial [Phycisphaerae bacterium]|nr:protein kinase [Phycisphaerae bacterium]